MHIHIHMWSSVHIYFYMYTYTPPYYTYAYCLGFTRHCHLITRHCHGFTRHRHVISYGIAIWFSSHRYFTFTGSLGFAMWCTVHMSALARKAENSPCRPKQLKSTINILILLWTSQTPLSPLSMLFRKNRHQELRRTLPTKFEYCDNEPLGLATCRYSK